MWYGLIGQFFRESSQHALNNRTKKWPRTIWRPAQYHPQQIRSNSMETPWGREKLLNLPFSRSAAGMGKWVGHRLFSSSLLCPSPLLPSPPPFPSFLPPLPLLCPPPPFSPGFVLNYLSSRFFRNKPCTKIYLFFSMEMQLNQIGLFPSCKTGFETSRGKWWLEQQSSLGREAGGEYGWDPKQICAIDEGPVPRLSAHRV